MLACLVLHLLCFAAIAAVNWNYNRLRDRDVARHGEVDEVVRYVLLLSRSKSMPFVFRLRHAHILRARLIAGKY